MGRWPTPHAPSEEDDVFLLDAQNLSDVIINILSVVQYIVLARFKHAVVVGLIRLVEREIDLVVTGGLAGVVGTIQRVIVC